MRVIAGEARGTRLETLPGTETTRPTVDRVKEGMFSSLQFILPGAKVLDLFAGSGQLGIEALSRGASKCVFIDENRAAATVVAKNLKAAGLYQKAVVATTDAKSYLGGTKDNFDIALLDPPYHYDTIAQILPLLAPHMAQEGIVLAETELTANLPDEIEGLKKKKQYKYGTVLVTRYEKE